QVRRHWFVIEHYQMSDDALARVAQGHPEVADSAQIDHPLVFRKQFRDPVRIMAGAAFSDVKAWRARKLIFKILTLFAVNPPGKRTRPLMRQTFGHETKPCSQSSRGMLDEGQEKRLPGCGSRCLRQSAKQTKELETVASAVAWVRFGGVRPGRTVFR